MYNSQFQITDDYELDTKISLDKALNSLKKRERYILDQRYIIGKTQMEIALELGISQAQISRIEKNAITHIKKKVKWSSKNKNIATVSNKGVVKGVKVGTTTIVAKCGKKKYSCKVTVVMSDADKKIKELEDKLNQVEEKVNATPAPTATVAPIPTPVPTNKVVAKPTTLPITPITPITPIPPKPTVAPPK